jgi:hypothetical protein
LLQVQAPLLMSYFAMLNAHIFNTLIRLIYKRAKDSSAHLPTL